MKRTPSSRVLLALLPVAALLLSVVPAAADCNVIPFNAGAVTPERAAECAVPLGPVLHADLGGSTAYGSELLTATLADFNLASPGTFVSIGSSGGPIGALEAACALVDGDASTLYCFDLNPINNFYSYNTGNGALTDIGDATPSGADSMTGLAWDSSTGTMFASGSVCGASSSLYTVNLGTGATTLMGTDNNGTCNIDIFVDNSGTLYSHDIITDSIYTINKNNGAMTLLGATGFNANYAQGAACDPNDGQCYLFAFDAGIFNSELRLVNLANGSTTSLGLLATNLGALTEVEADIAGQGGGDFTLTISGSCPGAVTVTTSGGSGTGGVIGSSAMGNDPLPGGPCAGTISGLSNPAPLAGLPLDLNQTINPGPAACGQFIQVLEVATCTLTNVDQLPQ